jgi:tetratricopeptide (TPR) repeat protein
MDLLRDRALADEAAGRHAGAEAAMAQALAWAPLDWRLYVDRARMEGAHGELTASLRDFRKARFLEPDYAGLPFQEGFFWLGIAPRFTIEAWQEALRRVPAEERADWYQNMLAAAFAGYPELRADLWAMAGSDAALQLVYFGWATPEEFKQELAGILREDPDLSRFGEGQLSALFPIWMGKGDPAQLGDLLMRHPRWLKAGYRTLAGIDAAKMDFVDAVDLMEKYLPAPRIPPAPQMDHAEAVRRFQEDNGDTAAGMALYQAAITAGREADALQTLRALAASPSCPAYVRYLEGQLLVKQGDPGEAWKALDQSTP